MKSIPEMKPYHPFLEFLTFILEHPLYYAARSVGILSLPDEPLPEDKLAFPEGDALDDLLQKPVSQLSLIHI